MSDLSRTQCTPLRRAHIALRVANLDRSLSFYRSFFGIEPSKVRADYAKFELTEPALNFTLNVGDDTTGRRSTLSHLGIELWQGDELERELQRIRGAGLDLREERATVCCYAGQDKFWVTDPDGVEWEFFHVTSNDEPVHSRPVQSHTVESHTDQGGDACCGSEPCGTVSSDGR